MGRIEICGREDDPREGFSESHYYGMMLYLYSADLSKRKGGSYPVEHIHISDHNRGRIQFEGLHPKQSGL